MLSDVVLHEACGPVTTQPSTAHFLGATVGSNNTGELTAWMEAALYLLGNPDSIPSSVTLFYDSKWAANTVTGKFKAKRNRSLVANAKRIYALLQSKTQVHWQWVKGHSGAKHNEHADALAEKGKQTQDYLGGRKEAEFFYTPATLPSESTPPAEAQGATSSTVRQALISAEEVTFKKQRYAPRTPWITSELAEKLQLAKNKMAEHDPMGEADYRIAKSQARKIKGDWVRANLEQAQNTSRTALWHASRKLKKGFEERKTRLKRNGRPVPWSKTHEVVADHLS